MKITLSRKNFMLFLLIVNPILDMIQTITYHWGNSVSINQMLRMLFVLITLTFIRRFRSFKYILLVSSWFLVDIWMIYSNQITLHITEDGVFLFKILTGYIYYIAYKEMFECEAISSREILHAMSISSFIMMANILLGLFGIGNRTYMGSTTRVSGFIGFMFNNGITTICLLMLLIVNVYYHKGIRRWMIVGINVVCLFLLATKVGVFGTLLVLFALGVIEVYRSKDARKKTYLVMAGTGAGAAGIIVAAPYLSSYIEGLISVRERFQYDFWELLISNRNLQIEIIEQFYISKMGELSKTIHWFGAGYSRINYVLSSVKANFMAVEMDLYGIYYYAGFLTLLIIVGFLAVIIKRGITLVLKKDKLDCYMVLIFVVACFNSILGGHVLYEAMVLQYLAVVGAYISARYAAVKQGGAHEKEN